MTAFSQTTLSNAFSWIKNIRISIKISLKFVPKGLINNIPPLVLIMAWRRPGDKPSSEPMIVRSLTHICVTRPQWVKLSEVNLSCGDIFIVIKVSTQQGAIWLIVWAFVQTHCKVNPFPQQNKMCFTGNPLVDFDYNACIYIVRYSWPKFVKKWQKCHEWSMRLGLKLLSEKELS